MMLSTGSTTTPLPQMAACVAPLLAAALHDHPDIRKFFISMFRSDVLLERILGTLDTSPEWNVRTGHGRNGRYATTVICDAINKRHLNREIENVFAEQGYVLKSDDVPGLIVERVARYKSHRLPTYLDRFDFYATKLPPAGLDTHRGSVGSNGDLRR